MRKYESVRFFLFTNSYSGQLIVQYFRRKYKKKLSSKKPIKEIEHLARILSFNTEKLIAFCISQIKPKPSLKRVPLWLKIYLEIEKELGNIANEKLDEYSTAKEDYQRQLLSPAIERAAGNSLGKIIDDSEFDEKLVMRINEYRNAYYKVAYKYKLPTIRIVPFILRIISY